MSSSENIIYLDYNATTYIHEEVAKEMNPYLISYFGNPSSSHIFGIKAKQAVQKSREQIAKMLGCSSSEIVFTSGGSESNNYAIKGVVYHLIHNNINIPFEIVTSQIEHPSVLEVFKYLEHFYKKEVKVIYLPVNEEGIIDIEEMKKKITPKCALISVMHANNETGSVQPIKEISDYAKSINPNVIIHTDSSQSVGKIKVDVNDLGVDLLTICSHKFYGPKGIGCLYIKQGIENRMEKIIHGANHEHNLRAGTENVLEIVGIGSAAELVTKELNERMIHFKKTRNIIYRILKTNTPNLILHGPSIDLDEDITKNQEKRLSNTLYISFPNLEANLILDLLSNKIACSAGAACHSDEIKMSYVLTAMNVSPSIAMGTLRISTGIKLTEKEAEEAANFIAKTVNDLYKTKEGKQVEQNSDNYQCRLTKNTHGMGCGCKISPKVLNKLLTSLPKMKCISSNQNIIVSNDTNDDACVYRLPNTEDKRNLISTLDFLTPICDSPYDYGAIACANAISDVYAMGGEPINALTIVAFPIQRLSIDILRQILIGASDKADEAGVPILGGHSIEDNEPKFGLSVNGLCDPKFVWKNSTIEKDNVIILTKPIGVGTIMTGVKRDYVNEKDDNCVKNAIETMKTLNKYHADVLRNLEKEKGKIVSSCTDITGFGLIGHLIECLGNSELSIEVDYSKVNFIEKAKEMIEMNIVPGGAENNFNFSKDKCVYDEKMSMSEKLLINDPQTSGGLLFFINKSNIDMVKKEFDSKNLKYYEIGHTYEDKNPKIHVIKSIS